MRAALVVIAMLVATAAQALDIPSGGVDRTLWCNPNPTHLGNGINECGPEPYTLIAHNCAESPGTFGHFPQAVPAPNDPPKVGYAGNGYYYWGYAYAVWCWGGDYGWDRDHAYGARVFYHCAAETPANDPLKGPWGWHNAADEISQLGGIPGCKDPDCATRRQKMLDLCDTVEKGAELTCGGIGKVFKSLPISGGCVAAQMAINYACKQSQPACQ